jgi:DNA helicase HerA-like ATPase
MLELNDTQAGVVNIMFRWTGIISPKHPMMSLHCLRAKSALGMDYRQELCSTYGHFTAASVATIQRSLLVLDTQGAEHMFGEPALNVADLMHTAPDGRGIISLIHADRLMDNPRMYAGAMLWLLSALYAALPEAGDLPKPKLVIILDEAHAIFANATPTLMETIERIIRLVRSKGVGVYFVTQNPKDVPETVLAQLGNKIQHALRAYTPKERRALRAVAESFRPPDGMAEKKAREWLLNSVQELGVGEALVSFLGDGGIPDPVRRVKVEKPVGQIGPIDDVERELRLKADPLSARYRVDLSFDEQWEAYKKRIRFVIPRPPQRKWWQFWKEAA